MELHLEFHHEGFRALHGVSDVDGLRHDARTAVGEK